MRNYNESSPVQDHINVTITTWMHGLKISPESNSLNAKHTYLQKELNYNTTDAKKLDFIADLESALKDTELTNDAKNNIRHQVTTNLLHSKHPIDLTKQERQALKDLKNDHNIVILPADKRCMTVVMDYSDYTNKAKELINDTNTYQPLDSDPSKTTVNHINKKLTTLRNQNKLSKQIYDKIRPNDATITKFY